MTLAMRHSFEILAFLRREARRAPLPPLIRMALWASLANLSWVAFRLAQVRVQPDAIATGFPGCLFRLVIRPLDLAMRSFHGGDFHGADPALSTIQMTVVMAICCAFYGTSPWATRGREESRRAAAGGRDASPGGGAIWT